MDPDRPTEGPFYHAYLERLLENDDFAVNLDCSHIRSYDTRLYSKLLHFPQEVVPIADLAVHELYLRLHPDSDGEELGGKRFTVPYIVYEKVTSCGNYPPDGVVTFSNITIECDGQPCTSAVKWEAKVEDPNPNQTLTRP